MKTEKIIAREVPPESVDFSFFFDDDFFNGKGYDNPTDNENSKLFIITGDRFREWGLNYEDYKNIIDTIDKIIDSFDYINRGEESYFCNATSYKEVMEDYDISYNPKKCHDLKELLLDVRDITSDVITEFLTIIRGKDFKCRKFCGYSQGDYCEVYYCPDYYSNETIELAGKMFLGCGSEFCIDDCYGFYVPDDIRWTEDERLVNYLANHYGCNPEELEVELYDGQYVVPKYKQLVKAN